VNPAVVLMRQVESNFTRESGTVVPQSPGRPTVLIATIDQEIREALADLLENATINAIWVKSVKDIKELLAKEQVVACFCGFWLQDGTYREVIRHLRRARMEVPAIIVSPPVCPQDYRDYLAAINLGTLDFLSYPYQQSDFDKLLESAITVRSSAMHQEVSAFDDDLRGAA
jgi:DNA-binding NtrC family response regulator